MSRKGRGFRAEEPLPAPARLERVHDAAAGHAEGIALPGDVPRDASDLGRLFSDLAERLVQQRRMTHTSIAIAAAAILDAHLEQALKAAMKPMSKRLYDQLFGAFRPLNPLSAKIITAHALGIVSPDVFRELEKIRAIRNKLAHSATVLNFESPSLKPLLRSLRFSPATRERPEKTFLASVEAIDKSLQLYIGSKQDVPGGMS